MPPRKKHAFESETSNAAVSPRRESGGGSPARAQADGRAFQPLVGALGDARSSPVLDAARPTAAVPAPPRPFEQSTLSNIRLDHVLAGVLGVSPAKMSMAPLNAAQRDQAIDGYLSGLTRWRPAFQPRTEMDSDDELAAEDEHAFDNENRLLQRCFDVALSMRNQDPEGAVHAAVVANGLVLGLVSLEPGTQMYVADLVTHPGTRGVGRNLLRFASETSKQMGYGGGFDLDAGDAASRRRYRLIGLKSIGEGMAMRYEPTRAATEPHAQA